MFCVLGHLFYSWREKKMEDCKNTHYITCFRDEIMNIFVLGMNNIWIYLVDLEKIVSFPYSSWILSAIFLILFLSESEFKHYFVYIVKQQNVNFSLNAHKHLYFWIAHLLSQMKLGECSLTIIFPLFGT